MFIAALLVCAVPLSGRTDPPPCDCSLAYLQSEAGWHAATLTVYYVHAGTDGEPWTPSEVCSFRATLVPGVRLLSAAAEDVELPSCRYGDPGDPPRGQPTSCRWRVRRPSGAVEVYWISCVLFADGFESGDMRAWSWSPELLEMVVASLRRLPN